MFSSRFQLQINERVPEEEQRYGAKQRFQSRREFTTSTFQGRDAFAVQEITGLSTTARWAAVLRRFGSRVDKRDERQPHRGSQEPEP